MLFNAYRKKQSMYRYISRLLLVSASTWIVVTTETNGTVDGLQQVKPSAASTIYVCQNKACCQRWKLKTTLPDVLHDILTSNEMYNSSKRILIEKSSCLGQCDKGPNLRISSGTAEDVYANGINDVIGLIAELDETLSIAVPSKLIAAVTVFEKAQTVPAIEEKLRYTSSIIRVLEEDDDLRLSTSNARAKTYQAEILSELGNYQEAIDEVSKVIEQLSSIDVKSKFHDILLAKAYRVVADVYEMSGNYVAAIESIQRMAATNPEMRAKVDKELQRLQQRATTT